MKRLKAGSQLIFRMTLCPILFLALSDICSSARAGLSTPFDLGSSSVLPEGVRSPQIKTVISSFSSRYDGVGSIEPSATPFNTRITWDQVVAFQSTAADKASIQAVMGASGVDPKGSPGNTTGDINVLGSAFVPVFAMGITPRLTLAIAVPVIHTDINADTGFVRSADGQKFIDQSCSSSSPSKCAVSAGQLNNAVNLKLTSLGYQPIHSESKTSIGDIHLVSKYSVYQDDFNGFAVGGELVLPTGTQANPDKAIDLATSAGDLAVGAAVNYDRRRIIGDLNFNSYASYTASLPDHQDMRIPIPGDNFTADKENVSRDLGDRIAVGTGLSYSFIKTGFNLGAGYSLQYLTPTLYSGSKYSRDRYNIMEGNSPSATLHGATLSAGFSSLEYYKTKRFEFPFDATLAYAHPLAGRNVSKSDWVAANVVFYF